jgi:hypothetical protein
MQQAKTVYTTNSNQTDSKKTNHQPWTFDHPEILKVWHFMKIIPKLEVLLYLTFVMHTNSIGLSGFYCAHPNISKQGTQNYTKCHQNTAVYSINMNYSFWPKSPSSG